MTQQAGRSRWWAAGLLVALAVALVSAVVLVRDGAREVPQLSGGSARPAAAAEVLRELQDAVARSDLDAAAALAPNGDAAAAAALRAVVENAQALRVRDFTLRYVDEDGVLSADLEQGRWAAAVDATWRFGGVDAGTAHSEVTFTFEADGDGALVAIGGGDRVSPLWLTTPLTVSRSQGTLVAVAGDEARASAYAARAKRAATVTRSVLGRWDGSLVVLVPETGEAVDAALGAEEGTHANIAAVTATADGSLAPGVPLRVLVNPEVYGELRAVGAQVVMSHEAVHVATRAPMSRAPLWLLEGFADYVALRDVDLPLSVTAQQIRRQVRDGGAPRALPGRAEFDSRTAHLGAAYEAAWIACRVLVAAGGEDALVELNRRVGRGAALEPALRAAFGFGERELVRRWRAELTRLAG